MPSRFTLLTLTTLLLGVRPAPAQGPQIDPTFTNPIAAYLTASADQIVQLASGQRVFFRNFTRAGGVVVPNGLARLLPGSNQIDAVFQANTAGLVTAGLVNRILALPNDKLLLVSQANSFITLGSVSRRGLLRLNADGTPDASFNIGTGFNRISYSEAVQPDGKVLLAGGFTQINGQPAPYLARLNLDGTLDAAFQAAGSGPNTYATMVVVQPNGGILVTGSFTAVHGQPVGVVARLLPSGMLDPAFSTMPYPTGSTIGIAGLATQSDNKIVMAVARGQGLPSTPWQPLMRLLPTGAVDVSFQAGTYQAGTSLDNWFSGGSYFGLPSVIAQPDNLILVISNYTSHGTHPIGQVTRILPDGQFDASFQTLLINNPFGSYPPSSTQLLPNGQILLNYGLFNSDGTPDLGFAPRIGAPGDLFAVVRQPDGRLLVGGRFTEISGVRAGGVARLSATGVPEATFAANAAANAGGTVYALALQPDGKVLVGGDFTRLGGAARPALARLNPDGTADTGFAPPIEPLRFSTATYPPQVTALARQANGDVLLGGSFRFQPGTATVYSLARVQGSTGQPDAGFALQTGLTVNALLAGPGDSALVAANWPQAPVQRLLPTGQPDPAFGAAAGGAGSALARDAANNIYLGLDNGAGGAGLRRLRPDGRTDPAFAVSFTGRQTYVSALAVQPNGRLLVGGTLPDAPGVYYGTTRLMPDGSRDASYVPFLGPEAGVGALLVQPDGAIVAAGSFRNVAGLPIETLTRLTDANVLALRSGLAPAGLAAWPVPAHGQLHLSLDPAAGPAQVQLLDALGRVARSCAAPGPTLTLDVAGLPPGVYVVRVQHHGSGTVQRRVVID